MALVAAVNIELSFGTRRILDGASLTVEAGEHVGLVGVNGCGKSTLLKIIGGVGRITPDAGQVQVARGAAIGYLTQDPELDPDRTLREEAAAAFAHLEAIQRHMHQIADEMAAADGDALERLMNRYQQLEHELETSGGYAVDHRIDATLHGLGLSDAAFSVRVRDLSGGQKGRLALAKLLLSEPDVLLLDEPTNHLDIAGRQWLEEFLAGYGGAVIMVSHDRWMLDRVVTRIYELERGRLIDYPGNYAKFRELRAERRLVQQREFDRQQTKIRHEKQFIDRYRSGQRAKQARGREKKLERFIRDEIVDRPLELGTMSMKLKQPARCGDIVVNAEGLTKGYENKPLFQPFNFVINRGDRIGIIGPNGAGKSTLVNCMLGLTTPDGGTVRIGSGVDIGHYRQSHEHLDPSRTVVEYLRNFVDGGEQEARDLAGAFLFSGIDQDKELGMLSGGERSRAVLAGLVAGGHNVLILDEPTNHLDIPSAERLEDALRQFCRIGQRKQELAGTLILITHDRMLLEDLCDQLLVLDGEGRLRHVIGRYSEFAASERAAAGAAGGASAGAAGGTVDAGAGKGKSGPSKSPAKPSPQTRADQGGAKPADASQSKREPRKKKNKAPNEFSKFSDAQIEEKIEAIETRMAEVDQQLADPQTYREKDRFYKLQDEREKLERKLKPLEAEWLARAEDA